MKLLTRIVARSRRAFSGSLAWRFALAVGLALLAGALAGLLPAVIGQAVASITGGSRVGAASGFARWLAHLLPAGSVWLVVLATLVATVVTVGISVVSSRLGSALAGDVTAAIRIELLGAVLGSSARAVSVAGVAIAAASGAAGPGPKGPAKPAAAPPGARPPAAGSEVAGPAARGRELVKLAISRESAMVADFAVSVLTGLPQTAATLAVLTYELVVSDAWFALLGGLTLFGLSRLLADRASRRVGAARRELQNADADVFGDLQEKLVAMEDLRLWGARAQAIAEFTAVARACAEARTRFAAALAVAGQIKSVFTAMSPLLILVALGLAGRQYDAGEVAKLLLLVPLLMSRLEALDALRAGLLEREPLLEAVVKLLGLPAAPPRAHDAVRLELVDTRGALSFRHVSFTPPGAKAPLISALCLDVPAGNVVGICGPSGSGKSSLLRLLLRLDDPDEGTIELDGVPLAKVEPDQLPALFGVVRQSSQLLERPLRDNLSIGLDPKPSDEQMLSALTRVQLDELVQGTHRPSGSGTPLGGEAVRSLDTTYRAQPPNFSGGELRRLLVARMLIGAGRVLVLDEPEAGLPSATAEEILRSTREHAAGRTVLVVTHAPHLLASDFNVVLDRGRIVDVGPHAELLERCELYRELLADSIKGAAPKPSAAAPG